MCCLATLLREFFFVLYICKRLTGYRMGLWRYEKLCYAAYTGKCNLMFFHLVFRLEKMGALDVSKVVDDHQGWRLITCIWLHGGLFHLLANMLSLLVIGIRLEQEFGFSKYINYNVQVISLSMHMNGYLNVFCDVNCCIVSLDLIVDSL